MKVDTSFIQFFSTETEGTGPVDLEILQKDNDGRLIRGRTLHGIHCNMEFIGNKQVQIEYWNNEKRGTLIADNLDEVKVNGKSLEPQC